MQGLGDIQPGYRHRGFTLIELIIVVAVAAILVGVAYPAYRDNVIKSKRSIARTALSEFVSRQESYYLDRKQYATTPQELGYPYNSVHIGDDGQLQNISTKNSSTVYTLNIGSSTELDAVNASLPTTTARTYTVRATPQNGQEDDTDCGQLALTHNGRKVASGTDYANCW